MIHPTEIQQRPPRIEAANDLRKIHNVFGRCEGILAPKVILDRHAETDLAFEALTYHECTHAAELHAFVGALLLLASATCIALAVSLGVPFWFAGAVAGFASWVWWRREQEIRADAVALYGAGVRSFLRFTMLHKHPTGLWGRWCYGRDREAREDRAASRCRRLGWQYRP